MADCSDKGRGARLTLITATLNEDLAFSSRFLETRRPHCPKCDMRMIAAKPDIDSFECFRCGHIEPPHADEPRKSRSK